MTPNRLRRFLPLLVIVVIAAAFRLPFLQSVPPPLNQDEASRGYDAWALLETGADRHGQWWPLFIESFGPGDYTAALSAYLTIPSIALLGPTVRAIRIPDAILGVLTVLILYDWMRRQCGTTPAVVASLALAICPWHVALCRTGHESGFAPFFMAAAGWGLSRAGVFAAGNPVLEPSLSPPLSPRTQAAGLLLAGVMLSLHAWVYPATRMFTPMFLLASLVITKSLWSADRGGRRRWGALLAGLALGGWPIVVTAVAHPERLAARIQATSLFSTDLSWAEVVSRILCNYAANLDPRYLFMRADEMSGASIPGVGLHFWIVAPFVAYGLIRVMVDARRSTWPRVLLAWCVLYPLPAAICHDWNPHPLRTVGGMLLVPILAGIGAAAALARIAPGNGARRWGWIGVVAAAFVANSAYFAKAYFHDFPRIAAPAYQAALVDAIRFAARQRPEPDFVLVTNQAVQPYIHALLEAPILPDELRLDPALIVPGPRGFHQVIRVGNYLFAPADPLGFPEAEAAFRNELRKRAGREGLVVERADHAWPGRLLATFSTGGGGKADAAYRVYSWRIPADAARQAAPAPLY